MRLPALALGALACAGNRPLERWDGCLLDGAVLEARDLGTLVPAAGDGAVLSLGDRWDGLPFLTDDGGYRSLLIELPREPGPGLLPAEQRVAQYRDGGQVVVYSSERLAGSIDLVDVRPDRVRVGLDLRTLTPSVDAHQVGSIALTGQVDLPRAASTRCP